MIHSFKYCIEKNKEVGLVSKLKGPLVMVSGFENSFLGEGVTFENGVHGEVFTINDDLVEVLLFSRTHVEMGMRVGRTGEQLSVSAGEGLLGHIVNPLGYTQDDMREDSVKSVLMPVEVRSKGLGQRKKVDKFLETGVSVVDLVLPIGMGQRELIIGDRKTGKTSFLLQTVLTQAKYERVCIYALIGKRKSEIKEVYDFLKSNNVLKYSIIVASSAEDSPGEVYLTPFTAMTLAEYFRDQGKDTVVIFDDLTTHAKYYREISLLGGRFPGRESYPGDIFYLHSKLLERAGNFKSASITCLPVAEAPTGDITGYIQTNLMSMTDGHLYFDQDLFFLGKRPAVNVFLSVTRVGKQTQSDEARDLGKNTMTLLKKVDELSRFMRFGSEVTPQVDEILDKGRKLELVFNQMPEELRDIKSTILQVSKILTKK